jgi:hypothetical protein
MLARAMRHSESTMALEVSGFSEVLSPLHIYKNGEKHTMTNYMSVSSLLSFFTISEKLTFTRLLQHFINNNILPKEQFSFKSNSPTNKAIFKLLNETLNAVSNNILQSGKII